MGVQSRKLEQTSTVFQLAPCHSSSSSDPILRASGQRLGANVNGSFARGSCRVLASYKRLALEAAGASTGCTIRHHKATVVNARIALGHTFIKPEEQLQAMAWLP